MQPAQGLGSRRGPASLAETDDDGQDNRKIFTGTGSEALLRDDDHRLVGSMHALRYAEENLPERHQDTLEALKGSKLKTARAWATKEMLRELWTRSDVDEALVLWKKWHCWATRCQIEPVKKVARMVKAHLPGILSDYTHRLTNAFSEGINGVTERIKNTARGYRNPDNFKTAIFFHCGGLKPENLALKTA